jgi:hydrogenase maturation protease
MMNPAPRILVAGIGNIFLADDAFGVIVAQRLLLRAPRDGVRIADFGIRGLDLVYALLDGCEAAILIDAVPRGHAPGTLFLIEPEIPDLSGENSSRPSMEGHSMDPENVLRLVAAMGGTVGRVLLVACEPSPIDPEQDLPMQLSPPVEAAIEPAVEMVESLISKLLDKPSTLEVQHASAQIESNA